MKTKYDLAIWHNSNDGETYAFPPQRAGHLGRGDDPLVNDIGWTYKGTLPKGASVADPKPVKGHRVRCTLAGQKGVNTAD